jgi:quinol monooxygenase YgiN
MKENWQARSRSSLAVHVASVLPSLFEVFSSAAAHEFHLKHDYTKRMFASLEGKMSGAPTFTKLSAL